MGKRNVIIELRISLVSFLNTVLSWTFVRVMDPPSALSESANSRE